MVYKLNGGDWNHGIWIDFPETVGNGIIIPSDEVILFRGVGITTNQVVFTMNFSHMKELQENNFKKNSIYQCVQF
jgi:hypothetical protein